MHESAKKNETNSWTVAGAFFLASCTDCNFNWASTRVFTCILGRSEKARWLSQSLRGFRVCKSHRRCLVPHVFLIIHMINMCLRSNLKYMCVSIKQKLSAYWNASVSYPPRLHAAIHHKDRDRPPALALDSSSHTAWRSELFVLSKATLNCMERKNEDSSYESHYSLITL